MENRLKKETDMLTATRREWNELYVFFALLAQGILTLGDAEGNPTGRTLPIARIVRQEHDGTRRYTVEPSEVHVKGEVMDARFPREDFATVAALILDALRRCREDEIEAPEGVEGFLDALKIYDMEARTDDRTDFYITFHDDTFPSMGFRIYSRLCTMNPILDGGRTANLKFEQTGIRFSQPAVNKINYTDDPDNPSEVARRMLYIESMGGVLKYSDVAEKIFRSNLCLIDLNFPRVLAEMIRVMHLDNITSVAELTEIIEDKNPLKIKEELIRKHLYYRYKIKEFLLALALGMRPAKLYNGTDSAVAGFVMVDAQGRMRAYRKTERQIFADYLFTHTRLEKGHPEQDKYGYLER
ncbi:MAG: HpaII family restriction endonuclease [Paraprevotella sp.]|nr:HpaII family restriction endonuclease [Paraprevotella sp.]